MHYLLIGYVVYIINTEGLKYLIVWIILKKIQSGFREIDSLLSKYKNILIPYNENHKLGEATPLYYSESMQNS